MSMWKFVIILFIAVSMGCATYERCAEKYGSTQSRDTTFVLREREVPVMVQMPADTIEVVVDCGSALPKYAAYGNSRRGYLRSDITAQESVVRVRTTIVPQYIHDTIKWVDTTTIVKERFVLTDRKCAAWKIAALVLAAVIALFVALMTYLHIKINRR